MELLRTIIQKTIFISKNSLLRPSRSYVTHKKDNETVRHFTLRVQQLVKKGWCNENAATINLKIMKYLQKDYSKN